MAELPPGIGIIERGSAAFTDLHVLHAVARDVQPDVIFCPGNHYTSVAAMTKLWLAGDAPPIVAKISNALVRADHGVAMASAYRWWLRRHPAFIDHFVAMSPAMRQEAVATMHVDPARMSVIAKCVISIPIHCRFSFCAAAIVVPQPQNASSTTPPPSTTPVEPDFH